MSRRIYLAARYSRRPELCGYRARLEALGYTITSRWLHGEHQVADDGQPIGEHGESLVEGTANQAAARRLRAGFAFDDFEDVMTADLLIAFTEPPRAHQSRGGRHVEMGIALGAGKDVIVCGPRENIFCWLDQVDARRSAESWVRSGLLLVVPDFTWCEALLQPPTGGRPPAQECFNLAPGGAP